MMVRRVIGRLGEAVTARVAGQDDFVPAEHRILDNAHFVFNARRHPYCKAED